jgi:hypothetical protein
MLRDALQSLADLETADCFSYEVLVVDNASTDHTLAVVEQVRSTSAAEIRYVHEPKKGIATARNRGLREAAGQWIAFFDDDQLADPRWLCELYTYATEYSLRAAGGPVHLQLPAGCHRKLHGYLRMLLGESRLGSEPFAYSLKVSPGTGNLMLHRTVFDQVGAFDESFAVRAEDTDLFCRIWRAGIETWYVPSALVHHVTPPARLESDYLQRLSTFMGSSVAERECKTLPLASFLPRALAKSLLIPPCFALRRMLASLRGDQETELGMRCRLRAAHVYAQTSFSLAKRELARCSLTFSGVWARLCRGRVPSAT